MGICESKEESVTTETNTDPTIVDESVTFVQFSEISPDFKQPINNNIEVVHQHFKGFTMTEWLLLILVLMAMLKMFLSVLKLLEKNMVEDNRKDIEKMLENKVSTEYFVIYYL